MEDFLEKIDSLHLNDEEQAHWEYVAAKFLENKMPIKLMEKEDFRFLKEHGWYAFFTRIRNQNEENNR